MIDTHCHIDLYDHPTEVADRANRARVLTISVTNLPSAFEKAYPHIKAFNQIRLALGLHPLLAKQHSSELSHFERLIDKTSYIGEVGLDFSRAGIETKDTQIDSFKFVFKALKKRRKFITIHSRQAESAVLEILEEMDYPFPVVFHWYSGNLDVLDKVLQKGHYFSVNPAMAKTTNGKKIISRIHPERVLTETDGPFVQIGGRTVEPTDVNFVERFLASEWKATNADVRSNIKKNFLRIVTPIQTIMRKQ